MQYERQGFTVICNNARPEFVDQLIKMVEAAQYSDLVSGDDSSHSWKELNVPEFLSLDLIFQDIDISSIIGAKPIAFRSWLNIYNEGEYIGSHMDKGGNSQIMIPIEVPSDGCGGELWLGDELKTIPVGVGDVLVFTANKLKHGTNPIFGGRRISFNGRIWT